ncbi:MAG TPA: hypothetical protein VND43_02235 [Burkholderiales bacterium]|nr:hypothetical protein [Burkholderiales bacterium]
MKKKICPILSLMFFLPMQNAHANQTRSVEHFRNSDKAQASCPDDIVVWLNLNSGKFYYKGSDLYSRIKPGSYVCRQTAIKAGDHPARHVPLMY